MTNVLIYDDIAEDIEAKAEELDTTPAEVVAMLCEYLDEI